jgi:hypothetical protein
MTTTQNTDETFDYMNTWEEETMIEEFEEYNVDNVMDEYRDVRGKGRDEWREGKRNRDKSRREERSMKRGNWD